MDSLRAVIPGPLHDGRNTLVEFHQVSSQTVLDTAHDKEGLGFVISGSDEDQVSWLESMRTTASDDVVRVAIDQVIRQIELSPHVEELEKAIMTVVHGKEVVAGTVLNSTAAHVALLNRILDIIQRVALTPDFIPDLRSFTPTDRDRTRAYLGQKLLVFVDAAINAKGQEFLDSLLDEDWCEILQEVYGYSIYKWPLTGGPFAEGTLLQMLWEGT